MVEEKLGYKYYEKRNGKVPRVKIYLGGPFFDLMQKQRVDDAAGYLDSNPTVSVIHCPFDYQSRDASIDNDKDGFFGSRTWVDNTFRNDIYAMQTSDVGVFLYDLDKEDSGTAMEIGFMYEQHKPVYLVPFYKGNLDNYELNLMIAGATTQYIDGSELSKLKDVNFDHPNTEVESKFKVF